jgi:hypothetical protein
LDNDLRAGGIDWYDSSGSLTASWRPSSDEIGLEPLFSIYKVQPLPDGSVFWAGLAGFSADAPTGSFVGLLNAERQLQWAVDIQRPALGATGMVSDVALAADGDLVVLAHTSHLVQGPTNPQPTLGPPISFVVEYGPDGSQRWVTHFVEGKADHVVVAPSGSVIVAGTIGREGLVAVGRLQLLDDVANRPTYALELDPAGRPVAIQQVELPAAIYNRGRGIVVYDTAMRGDDLVVVGRYGNGETYGVFATTNHLDGGLARELIFPMRDSVGFDDSEHHVGPVEPGPRGADVSPDGRIALCGEFSGIIDFGDGEVGSGQDNEGLRTVPFLAVLDATGAGVD